MFGAAADEGEEGRKSPPRLTAENLERMVQYGTIAGDQVEDLLRLMQSVFAPLFFEQRNWPDSIRNEFNAQLHRFLASLTDTRWKVEGKTVLYIPMECARTPSDAAAKDKELVQRLESAHSLRVHLDLNFECIKYETSYLYSTSISRFIWAFYTVYFVPVMKKHGTNIQIEIFTICIL